MEESHLQPKPMIEIGGRPVLWPIMKIAMDSLRDRNMMEEPSNAGRVPWKVWR